MFATHYHELTDIKFNNVKNLTVQVSEYNNEIVFMHKIIDGSANKSYGIHVAQMAGMPEFVVNRAKNVLNDLENKTIEVKPENIENLIDEPGVKPKHTDKVKSQKSDKPQLSLFGE